jgi:hypothetical protein
VGVGWKIDLTKGVSHIRSIPTMIVKSPSRS